MIYLSRMYELVFGLYYVGEIWKYSFIFEGLGYCL